MNEITETLARVETMPAKERTPAIIGAEVRSLTQQARTMNLLYAIEIGRRLQEAKELVAHGEWLPFLERETEFSPSGANRFMKLYAEYGTDQKSLFGAELNSSTLGNLTISNALRLLEVPKEEREEYARQVDAEHLSARELEKAIRERDQALSEKKELETQLREAEEGAGLALADAQERVDAAMDEAVAANARAKAAEEDARRQHEAVKSMRERAQIIEQENEELRARPATVERDEQAIAEAVAAAREAATIEYEKKLEEAAKRAKDAEDKLTKAREETKKAKQAAETAKGAGRAEAEQELQEKLETAEREARQARAALEAAEKRAKIADADTALFREYFETVQRDFARLSELLKKVRDQDSERGDKLAAAMRAVLDKCRAEMEL